MPSALSSYIIFQLLIRIINEFFSKPYLFVSDYRTPNFNF